MFHYLGNKLYFLARVISAEAGRIWLRQQLLRVHREGILQASIIIMIVKFKSLMPHSIQAYITFYIILRISTTVIL